MKKCASAQLQKVGELCDNGKACVHALGGTIAFSVNHAAPATDLYTVEIMTVATQLGGVNASTMVKESTTCVLGMMSSPLLFLLPLLLSFLCSSFASLFLSLTDGVISFSCELIGDNKGAAGHVMLHYATGGKLLVSAGHWIELARLDVSAESLLRVAESNYGAGVTAQISCELKDAGDNQEMRERVVQRYAAQFVQQSAPCQYQQQW